MLKYIYGNSERIFVNTEIGCNASCSYCYLPSLQKNGSKLLKISAKELIKQIESFQSYIPGKENTIISLGCYSECMHPANREDTVELVRYFYRKGNFIQMATKQSISENICKILAAERSFHDQINIYISMPTYSKAEKIERGTATVAERIKNIERCKKYEMNVVLYIKPFLEQITQRDLEQYINIVKTYKIPAVVGNYLQSEKSEYPADVGENLLYEKRMPQDIERFKSILANYTEVYEHSTDYIYELRAK